MERISLNKIKNNTIKILGFALAMSTLSSCNELGDFSLPTFQEKLQTTAVKSKCK